MKKPFLLILAISAGVFLTALFFIVKSLDSTDLSQKVDYFRSSFKDEETYFKECPKDSELTQLFAKHNRDFKTLQKMASEDQINSFQKQYIFHNDGGIVFPYVLGEFPGDKKITRDRFFKYLHLMESCKVKSISSSDWNDEDIEHDSGDSKEKAHQEKRKPAVSEKNDKEDDEKSKGFKFELYYGYDAKDKTLKDWITTHKDIFYWNSDNMKVVADTDKTQVSTPRESLIQQFRLEPHWFIRKHTYMDNPSESVDEEADADATDEDATGDNEDSEKAKD